MAEIIRRFLTQVRNVIEGGIIGNAFWYSVGNLLLGIMLETGILEKFELKIEKRIKNLGGEKRK